MSENLDFEPNRPIEPETNYGLWETLYGKTLSEAEKLEIRINLTNFFGILTDEHKKYSKIK